MIVVRTWQAQRDCAGLLQWSRCADSQEVVNLANRLRDLERSNRVAHTPAGDRISFRQAVDGYRSLAHAVESSDCYVLLVIEQNVFVDFVGDRDRVPFVTEIRDRLKLFAAEHLAG